MGFNVAVDERAKEIAKERGVDIKNYNIIYELVDQVKAAMEGLLEPDRVEESIGRLEVKQLFKVSRLGTIAGCMVREGRVERTANVRVIRGNQIIHTGKIESLKRFKDDVREVAQGYECGVKVKDFDKLNPGDQIDVYVIKEIARRLEAPKPGKG
jgi:translation initiation factor IF-2